MRRFRELRGYSLGLVALLMAFATAGYFYAGLTLNARPKATLPKHPISITAQNRQLELEVLYVNTPTQWLYVHRQPLTENQGILYRFPDVRDAGWTTQQYRVAISVAFLDAKGRVVKILDMEPCTLPDSRKCPIYAPGAAYRMALEVNRGWFRQNRVQEGDRVNAKPVP